MFRHLGAERRLRDLGDCSARVLGGERTSPSHHALIVCCSLVVLITALGPVAAQTIPARSPSTLDVFGAPLAAAQFDTTEYRADWGSAKINAATAYARGFTGLGVMVAVVDSGIDLLIPNFITPFHPYRVISSMDFGLIHLSIQTKITIMARMFLELLARGAIVMG